MNNSRPDPNERPDLTLADKLRRKKENGQELTPEDVGLNPKALPPYVDMLQRINRDMQLAIQQAGHAKLAEVFEELRGMKLEQVHYWLEKKKVFFAPVDKTTTLRGTRLIHIILAEYRGKKVERVFAIDTELNLARMQAGELGIITRSVDLHWDEKYIAMKNSLYGAFKS